MLNCGVRGRLRGRLYRHSRLTMEKRRRRIARLKRLQICTRTTPSRCRRRRRRISARKYFMIPVEWRQGCRRKKSVWLSDTNCGTMHPPLLHLRRSPRRKKSVRLSDTKHRPFLHLHRSLFLSFKIVADTLVSCEAGIVPDYRRCLG
jgi:hypothetical protein